MGRSFRTPYCFPRWRRELVKENQISSDAVIELLRLSNVDKFDPEIYESVIKQIEKAIRKISFFLIEC